MAATISDRDKFLLDLRGYIVIKNVLDPATVAQLNDSVDRNRELWGEPTMGGPGGYGGNMAGEPYYNFGNVLEWPEPDIFRSTIAHPRLVPYLDTLFGRGWRLASHGAQIFVQQKGSGGHGLHGSTARAFDPTHYYHHQNGEMRSGMIVCSFCLSDTRRGDGGFAAIPGSHKANFVAPESVQLYDEDQDVVDNVPVQAGDCILFLEATVHGALPWKAEHERRSLLFRYVPGHMATGALEPPPPWVAELTPAQQTAFEPPSSSGRSLVNADGSVEHGASAEPDPLLMGYRPRHIDEAEEGRPRATL